MIFIVHTYTHTPFIMALVFLLSFFLFLVIVPTLQGFTLITPTVTWHTHFNISPTLTAHTHIHKFSSGLLAKHFTGGKRSDPLKRPPGVCGMCLFLARVSSIFYPQFDVNVSLNPLMTSIHRIYTQKRTYWVEYLLLVISPSKCTAKAWRLQSKNDQMR